MWYEIPHCVTNQSKAGVALIVWDLIRRIFFWYTFSKDLGDRTILCPKK